MIPQLKVLVYLLTDSSLNRLFTFPVTPALSTIPPQKTLTFANHSNLGGGLYKRGLY